MSTRNLTCIGCPMGCQLTAELAGGEVVSVRGNTCARGEAYARKECVHPARTVTGTVRCEGGVLPVVSVRTADEVPKEKVFDVARALGAVTVRAPLHIGDVVLADAAGTGVAAVADEEGRGKVKSSVQGLGKETRERGAANFSPHLLFFMVRSWYDILYVH